MDQSQTHREMTLYLRDKTDYIRCRLEIQRYNLHVYQTAKLI